MVLIKHDFIEYALKFADVVLYGLGGIFKNPILNVYASELALGPQNSETRFIVGVADIGNHPPLKARAEPLLKLRNSGRRSVGRKNNLLILLVKSVECVEKLNLGCRFAANELNFINNENIHTAVLFLHVFNALVPYS